MLSFEIELFITSYCIPFRMHDRGYCEEEKRANEMKEKSKKKKKKETKVSGCIEMGIEFWNFHVSYSIKFQIKKKN